MESRYPIIPWTCWVSLLAHAVLLAVFFNLSANTGADADLGKTVYQVQLVEYHFDGDGLPEGGGGGSGSTPRERKTPDKKAMISTPEPAAPTPIQPENVARVNEQVKNDPVQPPVPAVATESAQKVNSGNDSTTAGNSMGIGTGEGSGEGSGTGPGSGSGSGNGGFGQGSGTGSGPDENKKTVWEPTYRKAVYSRISRAKIYPYAARTARMEGKVVVRFTVNSSGGLVSVSVVSASPYSVLNEDAEKWIHRAAPFPAFPETANRSTITFTYTLRYELKD